ncbi:MAG: hypothetical protein UHN59_09020, partial [Bacteroidales bacterium]|nr:hypothetical protein [Bacteroidales bacterium]
MKNLILSIAVSLVCIAAQAQTKLHTEYWSNGAKATEGNVNEKNIRYGDWKWYHDNGQLQTEGSYDEKGNKIGGWIYYYKDGKTQKTEVHSGSGEVKAFFPNGQLQYSYM